VAEWGSDWIGEACALSSISASSAKADLCFAQITESVWSASVRILSALVEKMPEDYSYIVKDLISYLIPLLFNVCPSTFTSYLLILLNRLCL
jgi:hypothetical protein